MENRNTESGNGEHISSPNIQADNQALKNRKSLAKKDARPNEREDEAQNLSEETKDSVYKAFAWLIGIGMVAIPLILGMLLDKGVMSRVSALKLGNTISLIGGIIVLFLWPWIWSDSLKVRSNRKAASAFRGLILNAIYWVLFAASIYSVLYFEYLEKLPKSTYVGVVGRGVYAIFLVVVTIGMFKKPKWLFSLTIFVVIIFGLFFGTEVIIEAMAVSEGKVSYKFFVLPLYFALKMFPLVHCIALGGIVFANADILHGAMEQKAEVVKP